jgi:hypothetical protein
MQAKVVHPAIILASGSGPLSGIRLTKKPAKAPQEIESVPIMAEADPS